MAYETFGGRDGSGAPFAWVGDAISGGFMLAVKLDAGADGGSAPVSAAAPLPIREPVKGNALNKGGVTSAAGTSVVAAANGSRTVIEIANGGASGIWLAFGTAAVAGQGSYLPSKATGYWPTTAAVNCILEASGTAGPVGFTEW